MRTTTVRWPMFRRVWRRAELLDRMIAALSLSTSKAVRLDHGEACAIAAATCLECNKAAECRAWLANMRDQTAAPDFCPNRVFFSRCQPDQKRNAYCDACG
ncbi:MAG: hypothetical protein KDJ36_12935 [Hyphomicrobiaceae bacterium]|nr:hypothetical protein [Hyphomicrobiaceae bacterium]